MIAAILPYVRLPETSTPIKRKELAKLGAEVAADDEESLKKAFEGAYGA